MSVWLTRVPLALLTLGAFAACAQGPRDTDIQTGREVTAEQGLPELDRQMQALTSKINGDWQWTQGEVTTAQCTRPRGEELRPAPDDELRAKTWTTPAGVRDAQDIAASLRDVFEEADYEPTDFPPEALTSAINDTSRGYYEWWLTSDGQTVTLTGRTPCLVPTE